MRLSTWKVLMISAACVATPALAGGCSDDGGSTGLSLDELASRWGETICGPIRSCYGPAAELLLGGDQCATELTREFENETVARLKLYISAGTVVYHPEKGQACLDALASIGCEDVAIRLPEVCEEAIEGKIARGGECNGSEECAGGDFCAFAASVCPGTCSAPLAAGEECSEDDECAAGLTCQSGAPASPQTCRAPADIGEACGAADDPRCITFAACVGEDTGANKSGTCKLIKDIATVGVGNACKPLEEELCQEGLSCVIETTMPSLTYVCATEAQSGGACKVGFPDPCPDGEFCDANLGAEGTCHKLPTEGQSCAGGEGGGECAPGLVCDGTNTCRAMRSIGGACVEDAICYSGTCTDGKCTAPPACQAPTDGAP